MFVGECGDNPPRPSGATFARPTGPPQRARARAYGDAAPSASTLPQLLRTLHYLCSMSQRIEAKVKAKRKRLYTVAQLARELGVNPSTVHRLEARPLSPLLERYLLLIGYRMSFTPRKRKQA